MKKVEIKVPGDNKAWGTIKTKYPDDTDFIGQNELTGDSKNFDSSVQGILTKRAGGINYNATTFATPNKDQYEAIFSDGAHHLLIVEGGNLRFSSGGGTFTLVTAGYASTGNFEFTIYDDRVYFDNGIDSPQVYDRATSYGGVAYTAPKTKVMGAQAPSSAVTFAADTAGGNVPAGAHTYKVTYLYYDLEESNGGPASAVHTVANPNNTVNLTAVPIGGYGVTARKIYRDNNDGAWLLVGTIANNTATVFTDTAAVGTAAIPTDHDVPFSFKYIVTHLDRNWIAGIPGDPSVLAFSQAGLPNIFPVANSLLCNPKDPITAIVVFNDRIIVFNRNSIGQIIGRTTETFRYSEIPSSIGCVDTRSIQIRVIEGVPVLVWLSDKGFYSYNGSSVDYLSDSIEDLVNLNIQQASQVRGQNAQSTQSQFLSGTASPGIDLTSIPGTITTPNPRRLWDDETDWEGGSSLTNIVTNDNSNQISVPTRQTPLFSSGTHNNTEEQFNILKTPVHSNYTGVSQLGGPRSSSGSFLSAHQAIIPPRSGNITGMSFEIFSADPIRFGLVVFANAGGIPGSVLYSGPTQTVSGGAILISQTGITVPVTGGQTYWIGLQFRDSGFFNGNVLIGWEGQHFESTLHTKGYNGVSYIDIPTLDSLSGAYTFSQSAVATTGIWTGPTYDSKSDSAVAATIQHPGTYPTFTSASTTVEASNVDDFSTGVISQSVANLSGSAALTLSNKRYWRIKIQLTTTDDRYTAEVSLPALKFDTTGTWISEVIDHTTDITTLDLLSFVTNLETGTTATIEIATSANNITYSSFGPVGSATPLRYSKVRITLTTDSNNISSASVISARLNWTLVANLISSGIDTGNTPAGWDVFQTQFTLNGGAATFYLRSATTLGGLTAASFVAVTNGSFPTVAVNQFVQWKVILTSTSDTVPTVDSMTVNWFISTTSSIRVASIFFNRSYYLAAAEYNKTTNNLLIVLDPTNNWRIYRGININTLSFFFNEPYYGSSTEGRIIKFLSGATDQGVAIEMIVDTKAFDFGDDTKTKVLRKLYISGHNTGAVYTPQFSVNNGTSWNNMIDPETGLSTFTCPSSDGSAFRRRFVPNYTLGQITAGKSIKFRVTEATTATAELADIKAEVWIRNGELVNV